MPCARGDGGFEIAREVEGTCPWDAGTGGHTKGTEGEGGEILMFKASLTMRQHSQQREMNFCMSSDAAYCQIPLSN